MRDMFNMDTTRLWGLILKAFGWLMCTIGLSLWRFGNVGRVSPSRGGEAVVLALLVLGAVCVIMGITTNRICKGIARMMREYDSLMHHMHERIADKIPADAPAEAEDPAAGEFAAQTAAISNVD